MTMNKLFIFGGSSTALEIFKVAKNNKKNFSDIYFVIGEDENVTNNNQIKDSQISLFINKNSFYIISFSDSILRAKIREETKNLNLSPINIICPSSIIFDTVKMGEGNFINSNCIVSSNSVIGDHNILNFSSQIGHDTKIGNDVILNPGARISGNCVIGNRVLVGSNSLVMQEKIIGDDTLIDALTYIDRDIASGKICSSKNLRVYDRINFK